MVVGPLDRRVLRTRCQACARRRIKCEGSAPCVYCTKKRISCVPQAVDKPGGIAFLHTSSQTLSKIPTKVPQSTSTRFTSYFFSEYVVKNDVSGGVLDIDGISAAFQSSPSLYHATIAVSALSVSKNTGSTSLERRSGTLAALTAYRTSITNLRTEIQRTKFIQNDHVLWTTFFLGLFELMYDTSGSNWLTHILYGTAQILQIRGPKAHLQGSGRLFFLTVRPFEICRSLIYSAPSFLAEKEWRDLVRMIRSDEPVGGWHVKEELFDLMSACSSLACRIFAAIDLHKSGAEHSSFSSLAAEGLTLRASLENWHNHFQSLQSHLLSTSNQTSNSVSSIEKDPYDLLAQIYYHATSIYLSGLFDYHPQFNQITSAILPSSIIQHHTTSIITLTSQALSTTHLAGIWFFFPLRVAGARVRDMEGKERIMKMLKIIAKREFVVAEAFVEDLESLWGSGIGVGG